MRGITKGLASNEKGMVVEFIPLESDIKLGDIFVTSGIGNSYPSGYFVGRVKSIDESPRLILYDGLLLSPLKI